MKIIFINNNNQEIDVEEETSLLRASIRYKAGMPFKCGGGMCKTCICKVEEGIENTNKLTKKELKLLTDEDIQLSKRLACQTIVNGSIAVSWEIKD
jgi:ferredoxin